MVSLLIVGYNTYVTLAEADSYLGDSLRASSWAFLDANTKTKALITAFRLLEKQHWLGTETGATIVDTVTLFAGGTGHAAGDILTVVGGTFGAPARIKVLTVAAGVVATFVLLDAGTYSSTLEPVSPVSTTSSGAGINAEFTLTFKAQTADQPRTGLIDCDHQAVGELVVAEGIEQAQMELAFELTQDGSLETASGTGSNNKRLKAGSAEIEYFKPTLGAFGDFRFPFVVMELLRCFLSGGTVSPPFASGTDVESEFDEDSYLGVGEGIY